MDLGDIYEDKVLDALFGATALTVPANYEVALSTTAINDDGTNLTEPVGNGYARVVIANNGTTWAAASAGVKANAIDIAFPTATGPWGTVIEWALLDQSSGDFVQKGTVNPPRSPDTPDTFKFLTGDLTITAD
jgi:hypothetical protein